MFGSNGIFFGKLGSNAMEVGSVNKAEARCWKIPDAGKQRNK